MNQDNIAAEVQRLREENLSIRDIAQRLGLTKYRVETTLHRLEAERLRAEFLAKVEADRTLADQKSQTESASEQPSRNAGQPNENPGQPSENLGQPTPKSESATAPDKHILLDASENITQKVPPLPRNAFVPGLNGFMLDYKRRLKEMHRDIRQKRSYWKFYIEGTLLKSLEKLQKRGQCLAQEQGLFYDELLLCGVLEACHTYLQHVVRTAPEVRIWMTMSSQQFLPNKVLMELLERAQQAEFDAVEPGQSSIAA